MGDKTGIQWTDATVNFWWGCAKVGPGCDHCYAETWDKRTGGAHWGLNMPRRKIKSAKSLLYRLDGQYAEWSRDLAFHRLPLRKRRVFIQSMSDLFDLEVPVEWFAEAWTTIKQCNRVTIQIVTKRVSVVEKRLAEIGETEWPQHIGLIITVCNQQEADRDIPRLLALKAKFNIPWVGVSIEPMLGRISLRKWLGDAGGTIYDGGGGMDYVEPESSALDWVICGGESGHGARPMHPAWARSLRDQCKAAGVPFFFKQNGEFTPTEEPEPWSYRFEDGQQVLRVGKKRASRLLDGVEHNEFPEAR